MGICSYFQRGMCHFGDKCRNQHISTFSYRSESKINEIRLAVTSEAEVVLCGKQWILSCFAPFRDKLSIIIPEFIDDISPEEVRWECYQAKANGTLLQYTQSISKKIEESTRNMQMLKNASTEIINFLLELYNGSLNTNSNNPFRNRGSNIFSQSVFDKPQSFGSSNTFVKPNVFAYSGQNNHLFQNKEATNPFLQTNQIGASYSQAGNIFNTVNSNVIPAVGSFSTSQPAMTFTFALQQPNGENTASSNLGFGQSINPFGQPLSTSNIPFGQSPTNSFGSVPNAANANAFGQLININNASTQILQNPTSTSAAASSFGELSSAANTNLPFQQPKHSSSANTLPFGQSMSHSAATEKISTYSDNLLQPNNSGNPFQSSSKTNDNPFLNINSQNIKKSILIKFDSNSNVYSDTRNLTDDDIAAFKSNKFKLGKVPVNPPSKEMCLK